MINGETTFQAIQVKLALSSPGFLHQTRLAQTWPSSQVHCCIQVTNEKQQ